MTYFIHGETFHVSGSIYEKLEITADATGLRQTGVQIWSGIKQSIQAFCAWRRDLIGVNLELRGSKANKPFEGIR
jgi:hypothetical protein